MEENCFSRCIKKPGVKLEKADEVLIGPSRQWLYLILGMSRALHGPLSRNLGLGLPDGRSYTEKIRRLPIPHSSS